jgi:hypothetical protein
MTKEEYVQQLRLLATKCKEFGEQTSHEWRIAIPGAQIPDDATDWEDLGEMGLFLTLEELESKANLVLHRTAS